ncbi:MAG TPA: hypothetical protein VHE30_02805 [Polyangiaceae bacterium]|nr:hypothetical protein [Polyangiaceae bacterium]
MNRRMLLVRSLFVAGILAILPRCGGDTNSSESHFVGCSDLIPCEAGLACEAGRCVAPSGAGGDGGDRASGGASGQSTGGAAGSAGAAPTFEAGATGGASGLEAGGGDSGLAESGAPSNRDAGHSGGSADGGTDPRCCGAFGADGGAGCAYVDGRPPTCAFGVCTLNPAGGNCAVDSDCAAGETCEGSHLCACGDYLCSSVLGVCRSLSVDASTSLAGPCPDVGRVTVFDLGEPDGAQALPRDLVVGPDGNVWVSVAVNVGGGNLGELVRVLPGGEMTVFPTPSAGDLALGGDGNFWIAGLTSIIRVTPGGTVTEFPVPLTAPSYRGIGLVDITNGPDGALWFTEYDDNQIGRITTTGLLTEFPLPSPVQTVPEDPKVVGAYGIAAGPDGNLWFTENETSAVGRLTPFGAVTEFPLLPSVYSRHPVDIQLHDGKLYFIENYSADVILAMSKDGETFDPYPSPFLRANEMLAAGLAFRFDYSTWIGGYGNLVTRVARNHVTTCDLAGSGTSPVQPFSLVTAPTGNVWFIEGGNHAVGFIEPTPL